MERTTRLESRDARIEDNDPSTARERMIAMRRDMCRTDAQDNDPSTARERMIAMRRDMYRTDALAE